MSKFQEAISTYNAFMVEKLGDNNVNESVLVALAKMLGNNIYDADASLVACSDKAELSRVKELFLVKELGLEASPKLDEAIKSVCKQMGASNRKKYRVVFYYLLLQAFGLESRFGGTTAATTTEEAPAAAKASVKTTAKTAVKKTTSDKKDTTYANLTFGETIAFYENFVVNEVKYPFYNNELMSVLAESTGTINEFGNMSIVDVTAEGETQRIKDNFLQGRLGLTASAELDEAIALVNTRMGDLPKYRVPFYYLLTKHLGREWAAIEKVTANLY